MTVATHLLLVSVQPTPNLTPALDPAMRPGRVILLVSPDMERRADWLETVLRRHGIRTERWAIADAYDVEHIQTRVLELLEAETEAVAAGTLALNATGGTKPMAIAAYEAFRAWDLPIFYVHPERDRLIPLHPPGPALELANHIGLDDFLSAHGADLTARADDAVPPALAELGEWLAAGTARLGGALGTLNWLAKAAEGTLRSPALEPAQMHNRNLAALIRRCADAGLLAIDGDRLRFADEAARFYANGGWLEQHVYTLLRGLRAELGIQDLARSVEIARDPGRGETVPNELDAACLAENRLFIVECKTRRWRRDGPASPGADALYRLDSLGDLLGGLQARALLVSYRALPPHVLRRAADLRIQVCAGPRLGELRGVLARWIHTGQA